jgi:hypothetical protein
VFDVFSVLEAAAKKNSTGHPEEVVIKATPGAAEHVGEH